MGGLKEVQKPKLYQDYFFGTVNGKKDWGQAKTVQI